MRSESKFHVAMIIFNGQFFCVLVRRGVGSPAGLSGFRERLGKFRRLWSHIFHMDVTNLWPVLGVVWLALGTVQASPAPSSSSGQPGPSLLVSRRSSRLSGAGRSSQPCLHLVFLFAIGHLGGSSRQCLHAVWARQCHPIFHDHGVSVLVQGA